MFKLQPTELYMSVQDEMNGFGFSQGPAPEAEFIIIDNLFDKAVSLYRHFGEGNPINWDDFSAWCIENGLMEATFKPEESVYEYVKRIYSEERSENSAEWTKHVYERNITKDRINREGVNPTINNLEGIEPFVIISEVHGVSVKICHAINRVASGIVTKAITSLVSHKSNEMSQLIASLPMDKAPAHLLPLVANLKTQLVQYEERIRNEGYYLSQNFDGVAELIKSAVAASEQLQIELKPILTLEPPKCQ